MDKVTKTGRRDFLKLGVLAGATALAAGVPLGVYVIAPALRPGAGKWIDFGPAENLAEDGMEMLPYEFMVKDGWQVLPQRGFAWARTEPGGKLTVFSSTCTHLACNVVWREDKGYFECPCHSGRFDPSGRPIAGPPTRPLTVLEHKIEDGALMVYLTV
jgi:Rieske Fe-S protein